MFSYYLDKVFDALLMVWLGLALGIYFSFFMSMSVGVIWLLVTL